MKDDYTRFLNYVIYGSIAFSITVFFVVAFVLVIKPWRSAGEYATDIVGNEHLTYAYTEGEPRLEDQLVFPDGWTPAFYVAYSGSDGRYICERDGEYRICIPKVVP